MYLKSLELHGFKSFPNKTTLEFERGATVVIGPNGSGKSNISDAMRWVLGEISSKNIRGNKMDDVIFGGTDTRRPMGFAEVSVTFDNTDTEHRIDSPYDEITITRRYYRSGDSEYFINKKAVRLRDIHELFMNTGIGRDGYSVIGQGKISEILSRKSEDRRNFFEEAAGISKFRYKKQEAERRLADTEENMLRINDILSELESRVGPLEKEAARARRYLELYEEKKRADVSIWLYDTEKLKSSITEADTAFRLSEHELELAQDTLKSLETQSDKLFEESQQSKLVSEQLLTSIRNCGDSIHRLDSEYKVSQNEAEHKKELMEQSRLSAQSASEAACAITDEQAELLSKSETLRTEIAQLEAELNAAADAQKSCEERARLIELESEKKLKEQKQLENEAMDVRIRFKVLESSHSSRSGEKNKTEAEAEVYRKEAEELDKSAQRIQKSVDDYKAGLAKADGEIAAAQDEYSHAESKRQELLDKLSTLKQQYGGITQRAEALSRMDEHFEGYSSSVKYIMKQYEHSGIAGAGTVFGPLSKLITTDKKYITAIETALGANLQNIVVDDENTAKAAIRALKSADAGRATFYPLTAMKPFDETSELRAAQNYKGYVGRADKLLSFEDKFGDLMSYLLGRTVVFDNIDNAAEMARAQKYKVRMVTLDGQIINAGGSFTGGSAKRDSGILSRSSDIEALNQKAAEIKDEISACEAALIGAEKENKITASMLSAAKQQKELLSAMALAESSRLEVINAKIAANNNLRLKLESDIKRIHELSESYEEDISSLSAQLTQLEDSIAAVREYRAEQDTKRSGIIDERETLISAINTLNIRIAEYKKDIDSNTQQQLAAQRRAAELLSERDRHEQRIAEYEESLLRIKEMQVKNRDTARRLEAELAEYTSKRSEVEHGTLEVERRLNDLRIKIREKTNHKELLFRAHTKNEEKQKHLYEEQDKLVAKLWEDYELTYTTAVNLGYPAVTQSTRAAAGAKQNECKNAIKSLGPVNVGAIEEYAEVKERYDNMKRQTDDLLLAKNDLRSVINKLDEEMRTNFMRAFGEINRNFEEVFSELFGGGRAELTLTDPEDILGSGIEIKAAPPGKIIKSLMLLSGGEQAFVAIALFFAIIKVNPTPFCILDEIEAALDEVNVNRFADYVKKFSHITQFVIITHRRGTIEAADRIYGVTMPERGISRVFALDTNEIEMKKKEVANGVF